MIREVEANLFEAGLPAIAHGCNCMGVMGGGIAVQFRDRYPDMHAAYRAECANGHFQLGDVFEWDAGDLPMIYNLGTQHAPGPNASLSAIADSVALALSLCHDRGFTELGIPRIGSGIGGLKWDDVRAELEDLIETWNPGVDIVVCTPAVPIP